MQEIEVQQFAPPVTNKKKPIAISCVIPTCDRHEVLREALDSVLGQAFQPHEIIVVNNGKSKVDLVHLSPLIKVLDLQPYIGVATARNCGVNAASGEFIAFLDDDDLWSKQYLEKAAEAITLENLDCVIGRLDQLLNGQIAPFKDATNSLSLRVLLIRNPGITGSNVVVRKSAFLAVGGYDPTLPPSEDKSLIIELLRSKKRVSIVSENQAIIRQHGALRLTDHAKLANGIRNFVRKYGKIMPIRTLLWNWCKIYKYRFKSGNRFALVILGPLWLLAKIGLIDSSGAAD